jgi:hypothetical protein
MLRDPISQAAAAILAAKPNEAERLYLTGVLTGTTVDPGTTYNVVNNYTTVEGGTERTMLLAERKVPLVVKPDVWTPIPMDRFFGGNRSLYKDGYILGGPSPSQWLFGAYLKLSSNTVGQGMVTFVRDIGGNEDSTGAQDWNATPGRDFISHMWSFTPTPGKPTGFKLLHNAGKDLTVEYAQLKAVQLL